MQIIITESFLNDLGFSKIDEKSYKTNIVYTESGQNYGFIELTDYGHFWELNIQTMDSVLIKKIHTLFDLFDALTFMNLGNNSGFDFNKIDYGKDI